MNITTRGKYGLKIITDLAMAYGVGRVNLKSIAKRQGLSEHYIEQLIAPLKKAGFVISIRGVHGGYSLARPPDGITVGAVLRTLEGSLAPVDCLRENDATCGSADCGSCITKSLRVRRVKLRFPAIFNKAEVFMLEPITDKIYADNAATTRVREEVLDEMKDFLCENYGNPSSIYEIARKSKKAVESARVKVANAIGAEANEIYFTGSGTESDNWAIKGIAEAYANKGRHIITSAIEHHAVLHTCQYLEKKGYEVTYLPVDEFGSININDLRKAIKSETILITIMFANNEIGTIQPIEQIGKIARENGVIFHTDAVQAVGHTPVDVKVMNIDLLSMSGHKLYAPKGTGVLYIKKGVKIFPLLHGGAQERNKRGGTENVSGIVAMGKAVELAVSEMPHEIERLSLMRNRLIDEILRIVPNSRLNGHPENRLSGNINISFEFIEGESILLLLDMKGIYASSGSACTSGSLDPSHVLLAIGLPHEKAHGSLRITLGRYNTDGEIDRIIEELPKVISRLREMSPLGNV
ncbi:cysteine desulfurylase family member [Holotrichia oblita]|nr:cysteine desulfurylase family member [Holotrichia oblita]